MELSWLSRIKVTLVLALGVVVYGIIAWPYIMPEDPMGVVVLAKVKIPVILGLLVVSFAVGLASYFISLPWGRHIGVLGVPAGLAAIALRSGNLSEMMIASTSAAQRAEIYSKLLPEGVLWFAFVAAGYFGVLLGEKICKCETKALDEGMHQTKLPMMIALGFLISAAVAFVLVMVLAKDVMFVDHQLGSVVGQPANMQIAFAVFLAFLGAGYVAKYGFGVNYIWPALASVVVAVYVMKAGGNRQTLEYMAGVWPVLFYPTGAVSVLPLQMVAFGSMGAVVGYWLAVRTKHWQATNV